MSHVFISETMTARGARLKGATCASCGQQYAYRMVRSGSAVSTTYYGFGADAADAAAQDRAREALRWKLNWDSDLVPCPRCGSTVQDMSWQVEDRPERKMCWWPIVLPIILIPVGIVTAVLSLWPVAALAFASAGAAIVAGLLARRPRGRQDDAESAAPSVVPPPVQVQSPPPPANPNVWSREQLESAAREDPSLDISGALLDWEVQKTSTASRG